MPIAWAITIAIATTLLAQAQSPVPSASKRIALTLPDGAIASLPASVPQSQPKLIVLLHGAGQLPGTMIDRFSDDADFSDAVLLAPKAKGLTWDVVRLATGRLLSNMSLDSTLRYASSEDGDRVRRAIAALEQKVVLNSPKRVLLGFSDGATFALAFGTGRTQPFDTVIAIAPGLAVTSARPARGREVIVMHGTKDRSLPFEFTRSTIVPQLRASSLAVRFIPFDGGHEIPDHPLAALSQGEP